MWSNSFQYLRLSSSLLTLDVSLRLFSGEASLDLEPIPKKLFMALENLKTFFFKYVDGNDDIPSHTLSPSLFRASFTVRSPLSSTRNLSAPIAVLDDNRSTRREGVERRCRAENRPLVLSKVHRRDIRFSIVGKRSTNSSVRSGLTTVSDVLRRVRTLGVHRSTPSASLMFNRSRWS